MSTPSLERRVQQKSLIAPPEHVPRWLWRSVSRLTGVDYLEGLYRELPSQLQGAEFATAALAKLGVTWDCESAEWERIPTSGPVVIAANHPYGGIDGLAAIAGLHARRSDLRVIATAALASVPALRDLIIPVDNFGRREAFNANLRAARLVLRHIWSGGALLIFPAGEVAHLDLATRHVSDPPWKRSAITLIRAARAPVVPLYVHGSNSISFQLMGLLHPLLRTAMLPREVANKRGMHLDLRIGNPLSAERIGTMQSVDRLGQLLRVRLYSLAAPRISAVNSSPDRQAVETPAAEPVAELGQPELLIKELSDLGDRARLATLGNIEVHLAHGAAIPLLLHEIGRLREITFRAVGEGTGHALDLDRFDRVYEHLIAWDSSRRCVVGGYRLARMDETRRRYGRGSLYLNTLFEFRDPLLSLLGPTLELGRAFVRPEYQRSYAPLLALWRGIGEYVARNPKYSKLVGPVSVTADYDAASRDLLVRYLRWHHFDSILGALVRPRTPYHPIRPLVSMRQPLRDLGGIEQLSTLISQVNADGVERVAGVPILLRQYLKLGGRVLSFNVDAAFGHCVDCLTLVDLTRTRDEVLSKYMSVDGLTRLRAHHSAAKLIKTTTIRHRN